jgi:hypothetical protein
MIKQVKLEAAPVLLSFRRKLRKPIRIPEGLFTLGPEQTYGPYEYCWFPLFLFIDAPLLRKVFGNNIPRSFQAVPRYPALSPIFSEQSRD